MTRKWTPWAVAALAPVVTDVALADCTCRALGRSFELGHSVCLQTSNGPRLATCGMMLNNTSWHVSETPCVAAEIDPAAAAGLAEAEVPPADRH